MPDDDVTDKLNNVRLFLGSPGGVEDERAAVRRVADGLNATLRRHGWQVEVLGWEDRGPASGRAQQDINADVERCDIFIGIVWDRWGTPTGEHSSGFAEEWHLASARCEATGIPELWLCFKHIDAKRRASPDEQLAKVLAFKDRVQRDEIVFYESFRSPADLEVSVRRELLDHVLKRAGLSRRAVGHVAVDWESALAHEPVALLQDGPERERLAGELAGGDPPRAAAMFVELADEVEHLGFDNVGDSLRDRAARALDAAGRHDEALRMWRQLLMRAVESGHPVDAASAAGHLRDHLAPERDWEALAWMACVEWPGRPKNATRHLREALATTPATPANVAVRQLWRRTLWEVQLNAGDADEVIDDARRLLDETPNEFDDDLSLLHAEALSAADDPSADEAWRNVRARALDCGSSQPARAARLIARWGVHLTKLHAWTDAEQAFVRAATLWGHVPGYEEEAAACFFSAQTAGSLSGEWIPRGWSWRPLAASLRGTHDSLAARARERQQGGLAAHVDSSFDDARRDLSLALVLHRRAGHLGGIRRVTRMLGDVERDANNPLEAVLLYCEAGDSKAAAKAARHAPARELTERLRVGGVEWQTRAACAVLGVIGRYATEHRAAQILPHVLELSVREPNESRETEAADALSQLVMAAGDEHAPAAVARLVELLHSGDYGLEGPAAGGLAMLVEVGRLDGVDWLVARFVHPQRGNDISPRWIAEHLDTPARVAVVREAALAGNARAMHALGLAGRVSADTAVERACSRYVEGHAQSNLGYTQDQSSIHGLMALDLMGDVAAHCASEDLRRSFAEMLLVYALETRWPMVNRVKAVQGLAELSTTLEHDSYAEALRPLADPQADHDEEARPRPMADAWVTPGELEATAIVVAVKLAAAERLPAWLHAAVERARVDERDIMRAAAWQATASTTHLAIDGIQLAMVDPEINVRAAALRCFHKRATEAPPAAVLNRLAGDPVTSIRVALVELLADAKGRAPAQHVEVLLSDEDAYVRRLAALRFRQP